jgi:hypothetical protein
MFLTGHCPQHISHNLHIYGIAEGKTNHCSNTFDGVAVVSLKLPRSETPYIPV